MKTEMLHAFVTHMWAVLVAALGVLTGTQSSALWLRMTGFTAAALFALLFCVRVTTEWLAIYESYATPRELARLRQEGRKRYTEWWTFCQTAEAAECQQRAEEIQARIRTLLAQNVGADEADYFNNAGAAEPFPETNLRLCPQAVLINEFGHRLDRLGEIIQRVRGRRRPRAAA